MNDLYERVLAVASGCAKNRGYAIGLHGSGIRDLDLIAVPWTAEAIDGHDLAREIAGALKFELKHAYLYDSELALEDAKWPRPVLKPHGRVGYTIWISPCLSLDLSVMPRRENKE